ncbi:RING finger protein 212B [Pelobates fuscus]|uniref:RING finger protein 212B n=1 Tax=Pelobates fuscus TaxID=191477 RepID=UPI002FE45981
MKRENTELKSLVSILKGSLNRSQNSSRSCTPRPVAITSPSQIVTPRHSSQQSSQVVSRSSPMDSISHIESRSGGFSQSASSYGILDRSTPLTSNQESPMSVQSVHYCAPSTVNYPFLGEEPNVSREQMQTSSNSNTPRIYSESNNTPASNAGRLRSLQLVFTPRTPRTYQSAV